MTDIDPHAIMRELGCDGLYAASVLAENRGKAVWRMEGDGGTFALRILRPDEHETASAEQGVMELARGVGVPAPQVLATGTWRRRPVMLLSWCRGQTLSTAVRDQPWDAFRLGMACGREQARLNETPAPEPLGAARWLTRFGPLDPELRRRLERIESSHSGVLHLDCHGGNILVAGGEVTGLLDWTNACAGDGRADLARSWSFLTRCSGRGPRAGARAFLWRVVAAGWQRGYEQVAGRQRDMLLFRIWALTGLLQTSRVEAERAGRKPDVAALQRRLARMRDRAGLPPVTELT